MVLGFRLQKLTNFIKVVPRASAVIPGLQNAEQIALNRDHISMVKFETETDDAYMKVVRHVTKMVKDAPRAVDAAWRRHTQQLSECH